MSNQLSLFSSSQNIEKHQFNVQETRTHVLINLVDGEGVRSRREFQKTIPAPHATFVKGLIDRGYALTWTRAASETSKKSTHVAILQEPYFSLLLKREKTIESRFTKVRCAPFDQVNIGDEILIKKPGKDISARCTVQSAFFYEGLTPSTIRLLIRTYKHELRVNDDFLNKKVDSKYATLIWVSAPVFLPSPIPFKKKDRRAWVICPDGANRGWEDAA